MNKLTWTAQILLSLVMGLFGLQKVVMAIPDLIAAGMWWIEDFAAWQVRVIGALEVLGALGMLLPYAIKALPKILVPLAAGGLTLTMVGAISTHLFRGDPALSITLTSVFFAMGALVATRRWKELGLAARPSEPSVAAARV